MACSSLTAPLARACQVFWRLNQLRIWFPAPWFSPDVHDQFGLICVGSSKLADSMSWPGVMPVTIIPMRRPAK